MIVPERPEAFVNEFLPRSFEELRQAQAAARAPGQRGRVTAPLAVGLRVVGAGEWTLRLASASSGEPELGIERGITEDVALSVSLAERDFVPLVVEPLRRAADRARALAAADVSAATASLWSRLGRWDRETVTLLRQQTGRILVRVSDAGTVRAVALTPGLVPFSLEQAECMIDCNLSDLLELSAKRQSPLDLFYSGQLRISGDAQIALALAGLFI